MAIGYSHVDLIGNLGKDPEMSETGQGMLRASFSLAVNRVWSDVSGERRQETDWFPIVAWGRVAEICRDYLAKGRLVFISGRLQNRRWQDENGQPHRRTEVIAREVILLDRPENEAEEHDSSQDS